MRKSLSIGAKILLPTIGMLALLIVGALFFVSNTLRSNTIDTATMDAKSTLKQVTLQRELYTKAVVGKLKKSLPGVEFSTDHANSATTFPPPATFLLELSDMLSKENGVKFDLYSPYPFANRFDRKLSPSQQNAWDFFKANPNEEYFVATDVVDGNEVLRVHQGDYMVNNSCTGCHNKHIDSPKTDWNIGDLRGVLEVIAPIEPQLAQGRQRLLQLTMFFSLAGLLISVLLFIVIRKVTASLKEAVDIADELHHGNLTVKGKIGPQDEAGKVTVAINAVAASLHKSMTEVAESSSMLTSGSQHITEASKRITTRSARQNDSLAQVSAIMQEVEAITIENSQRTKNAENLSMQAHTQAEQGTQQMTVMLQAMEEINESSKSISGIITTIDEIAFQTNILSINASVEAAHAGEHGKGFAIVATEVRSLALRSAEAARETTALIDRTAQKVAAGSEITLKTAAMLDDIMESSIKVVSLMKQISQATSVQATEVGNVNKQINDLEALSKDNLDNSGQTAVACEQLAAEAQSLLDIVSRFKLKED